MPGRNMTGPRGEGMLTGRGMGPCGGGASYRGFGRGAFGCGRGFGRGYGYYTPEHDALDHKEMLLSRQESLKRQLDVVAKRLEAWKEE